MPAGRARTGFAIPEIGILFVIRFLIALCLAACCACTTPPTPDTKVIVGATLMYRSEPSLEHSVVVIKDGHIAAVGSQQMTPIPPGSTKIEAYGKFLAAAENGEGLRIGSEANLVLFSADPTRIAQRRSNAG